MDTRNSPRVGKHDHSTSHTAQAALKEPDKTGSRGLPPLIAHTTPFKPDSNPSPDLNQRHCSNLDKARQGARQKIEVLLEKLKGQGELVGYTPKSLELEISEATSQLARLYRGVAVFSPDVSGTLQPVLTFNATKVIWEHSKPDDASLVNRWRRTKWINLTDDMTTNISTLSHILNEEITRCGGYQQAEKKGHWIPVMADIYGHFALFMLRWTGNGFRAVISGSLGYGMYTEKDAPDRIQNMILQADDATAGLILCLSEAINSVCSSHLKKHHQTLIEQLKANQGSLTPEQTKKAITDGIKKAQPALGQILFLEPQRQHDCVSCSTFALHDLFSLLPKSASSLLNGDKVQVLIPADPRNLPDPAVRLITPVPVVVLNQYPDINYYKLTNYPVEMLKPCQSLSTIESEVSQLKSHGVEHHTIDQFWSELQPYIREIQTEDGKKKKVNTYAITRHMENLLILVDAYARMEKVGKAGQSNS